MRHLYPRLFFGRFYFYHYVMCPLGLHLPGWPVYVFMRLLSGHLSAAHSAQTLLQFGCDSCARRVVLVRRCRCSRCERAAGDRLATWEAAKGLEDQ